MRTVSLRVNPIGGVSTTTQSNDSLASSSSCFIAGDTSRLIGSGTARPDVNTHSVGEIWWTGSRLSVRVVKLSVRPSVDARRNDRAPVGT